MKTFAVEYVEEYARLKAQIKDLEATRKSLRERILRAFHAGLKCPTTCPYILEYSSEPRRKCDWRGIAWSLAERLFKDTDKATRYIERKWDAAPKTDVEEIEVKANPKWMNAKKDT